MPPLETASFNQQKRVPFENMIMVEMDYLAIIRFQWPLLLTWFNFNPSMDM